MNTDLSIMLWLSATIALTHTILGPDHYLPFIVMSKARKWSIKKTVIITFLSGLGHVLSSVLLGLLGIFLGTHVNKLVNIETYRGEIASWMLIGFGFMYLVWALKNLFKKKHDHNHFHEHDKKELTPLILFVIFLLGPCEPLIPVLMYPALKGSLMDTLLVTFVFSSITLCTMMLITVLGVLGIKKIQFPFFEKFGHVFAGVIICGSGLAIKVLGI